MSKLHFLVSFVFIVLFVSVTAWAVNGEDSLNSASAETTATIVLTPVADAYIDQSSPAQNFGASSRLRAGNSPTRRSYLRFSVPALSAAVKKATLRLYSKTKSRQGYVVRGVLDQSWSEAGLNYNNAPAVSDAILGASGKFDKGTWTSIDVSSIVTGSGTFDFALTGKVARALSVYSREAGQASPQLIIKIRQAKRTRTPTATQTPIGTATGTLTATATPSGFQPQPPIRAAFFYPWFPKAWTQGGVFPYTNYTPSLGYYSSTDDATIDAQLRQADQAHLQAFISSWWGQGHHTDTAFAHILGRSERAGSPYPNLRWSLYYEGEGQGDPTVSQIVADLNYLTGYFSHAGFLRVDGKPVVFVYADAADGCAMTDRWAQAKQQFGGNVYIVLKVFSGYKTCASQPDSWHQYAPAVAYDSQAPYSVAVSPGFWKKGETPRLARDSARFEQDVQRMAASGATWQTITTWSEWGEGSVVEPAQEFGTTYLDILCRNLPGSTPCGATTPTATPTHLSTPSPTPTSSGADPVIAAAGDIACDPTSSNFNGGAGSANSCHMKATSDLVLAMNPAAVLVLGDNQYEEGTLAQFQQSYDLSWGRFKFKTYPSVGNHEYLTSGASGYYQYFGARAGDPSKGYYSFDIGAWHLIALNSNCSEVNGCGAGSPQEQWLRADLAAHPNLCTLAFWHHPRFSSGPHGSSTSTQPLWQALYDYNAEVVLNGHDHDYERFAPQDPGGGLDTARGIREFVVGSGGKNHSTLTNIRPNSEASNGDTFGVLKLTLRSSGYDWQFAAEPGKTFADAGTGVCH